MHQRVPSRPWVQWSPAQWRSVLQFAPAGAQNKRWQRYLFVPGETCLYAAPSLVAHYVDAHEYRPPEAFLRAVRACPPMKSMAYLKAIRAFGARTLR